MGFTSFICIKPLLYSLFPKFPALSLRLIKFANSWDIVQYQQNVGSGYRPFDTLIVFLKEFVKKLILIKSQQMIIKVSKNIQRAKSC